MIHHSNSNSNDYDYDNQSFRAASLSLFVEPK